MTIQLSSDNMYNGASSVDSRRGMYNLMAAQAEGSRKPERTEGVSYAESYEQILYKRTRMPERPADGISGADGVREAHKSVSNELLQTSRKMSASYPPPEERLLASVDNKAAVDVSNVNSAAQEGAKLTVTVTQTASAQENGGKAFKQDGVSFNEGANNLRIESNQGEFNININVKAGEKNDNVINKTRDAINRRDIGIAATAERENGLVSLSLKSEKTGVNNAFTVDSTDFSKRLGINAVTSEAKDAKYTVDNGTEQSSSSNTAYIGKGITAVLKEEGEATVTVSPVNDKTEGNDNTFRKTGKFEISA